MEKDTMPEVDEEILELLKERKERRAKALIVERMNNLKALCLIHIKREPTNEETLEFLDLFETGKIQNIMDFISKLDGQNA